MHDALFVHVSQSGGNLVDVVPNLAFFEVNVLFDPLFYQQFEVALLGPLDRDEQFIQFVVDEPVEVLHYVWVV